jgi:hypothetical protein
MGLACRMGSLILRNSTVPTAEPLSMGVKRKKLRGETITTSYMPVSMILAMACALQPCAFGSYDVCCVLVFGGL